MKEEGGAASHKEALSGEILTGDRENPDYEKQETGDVHNDAAYQAAQARNNLVGYSTPASILQPGQIAKEGRQQCFSHARPAAAEGVRDLLVCPGWSLDA